MGACEFHLLRGYRRGHVEPGFLQAQQLFDIAARGRGRRGGAGGEQQGGDQGQDREEAGRRRMVGRVESRERLWINQLCGSIAPRLPARSWHAPFIIAGCKIFSTTSMKSSSPP
jgi:hypothetical protein